MAGGLHRISRYLWASPATLLGLCLALIARTSGARVIRVGGVIEACGGRLGRWVALLPKHRRFGAITFGHVVLAVDEFTLDACRAHERAHVRQYERWGILFFPLYAASSLWAMLRGRRLYFDNHFERQAREACAESGPYV